MQICLNKLNTTEMEDYGPWNDKTYGNGKNDTTKSNTHHYFSHNFLCIVSEFKSFFWIKIIFENPSFFFYQFSSQFGLSFSKLLLIQISSLIRVIFLNLWFFYTAIKLLFFIIKWKMKTKVSIFAVNCSNFT